MQDFLDLIYLFLLKKRFLYLKRHQAGGRIKKSATGSLVLLTMEAINGLAHPWVQDDFASGRAIL